VPHEAVRGGLAGTFFAVPSVLGIKTNIFMLIDFDQQPDHARVWIYQSSRPLTGAEAASVQHFLENQANQWAAHGAPLTAAVRVLHRRFAVVAVDETRNGTSGCSIDASTRWLKDLGAQLNLDFFDRSMAYLDGDEVKTLALPEVKIAVADGRLTPETPVFNNLVPTLGDFRRSWQVPAGQSWLKRYFTSQPVGAHG
jgi:hypothetical protein